MTSLLTAAGFQRKTYEEFVEEMQANARELWGADVDLADYSPLGMFIKDLAYQRADENELTEAVYNAAFVDNADGISLDYAVKFKSLTRFAALPAVGTINFYVDPGVTVPQGLLVSTLDGIQFYTTAAATDSDNNGVVVANIQAAEAGEAGNVQPNTINVILTPASGVNSVNNLTAATGGRDLETDAQLRGRYHATTGYGSTVEGIQSKVLNDVAGVKSCIVIENDGDVNDAAGRTPHSLETIVLGGASADIATAIFKSKPGGIKTVGSTSVTVKDLAGNDKTISFSYATQKTVYIRATVTKNASFPTTGATDIQNAILAYINGLGMGGDIILGKLSSIAFGVPGVDDVSITTSTNNSTFTAANVVIAATEVAQTSAANVVITLV